MWKLTYQEEMANTCTYTFRNTRSQDGIQAQKVFLSNITLLYYLQNKWSISWWLSPRKMTACIGVVISKSSRRCLAAIFVQKCTHIFRIWLFSSSFTNIQKSNIILCINYSFSVPCQKLISKIVTWHSNFFEHDLEMSKLF